MARQLGAVRSGVRNARKRKFGAQVGRGFALLEGRDVPAVVASFSAGTLTVFGDNLDNVIAVSRDAAGKLFVNGGAVTVQGGTATVANTSLIQVFGQSGNDTVSLNESNGAL